MTLVASLVTPPQPAFGEADSAESMSASRVSGSQRLRNPVAVSETSAADVQQTPERATCDSESHADSVQGDLSEIAILFHNGSIMCPACPGTPKLFTNVANYRNHRVSSHKLPRYSCAVCSSPFNSLSQVVIHMLQRIHPIKCPICPNDFYRPPEATSHFTRKHRIFDCIHCGASLNGSTLYKQHINNLHPLQGIDYVPASSLVEATLNTSFHETVLDDSSVDQVEPNLLTDEHSSDILRENVLPDSTSFLTNASASTHSVFAHVDSSDGYNSHLEIANNEQSITNTRGSDTDSVIAEENVQSTESQTEENDSDSVITIESIQPVIELEPDVRDSDADSVEPVQLLRNPFHEENVVFGPGAEELLDGSHISSTNDQSQISSTFDQSQISSTNGQAQISSTIDQDMLWIGHDVDMFQAMSEKHKKIYRYKCSKCTSSYRNKEMFKRHLRVHEYICKHCFMKFDSKDDFKQHKKSHSTANKSLICQSCAHKIPGLKELMVHEMRHRLNTAFRRKMKEFLNCETHPTSGQDLHKCSKCQLHFKDLSFWIRHEVWHNWSQLWSSYVTGRTFTDTFKVEDSRKFEKAVEIQLKAEWKQCAKSGQLESDSLNSEVDDHVEDDMDDDVEILSSTEDINNCDESDTKSDSDSESVSDSESDCEDGIKIAVNGWMSYWQSYLGLSDTPPKWVMPILKELRSKWKYYHMGEQDSLYKQMDQIAFLIRAERNEVLPWEGPRVVLKRIPNSQSMPKMIPGSLHQLKEAEVVLVRMPEQVVTNGLLKLMKQNFLSEVGLKIQTLNQSKESPSELSPDLEPCCSSTLQSSVPSLSSNDSNAATSSAAHVMKKNVLIRRSDRLTKTVFVGPKSKKQAPKENRKRSLSGDTTADQDCLQNCKIFKNSEESSCKVVSPTSSKISCQGICRPIVILDRLSLPQGSEGTFHTHVSDSSEAISSSPSAFRRHVNPLITTGIGTEPIPKWAIPQVKNVCNNNSVGD